jgi:hypothetical protein
MSLFREKVRDGVKDWAKENEESLGQTKGAHEAINTLNTDNGFVDAIVEPNTKYFVPQEDGVKEDLIGLVEMANKSPNGFEEFNKAYSEDPDRVCKQVKEACRNNDYDSLDRLFNPEPEAVQPSTTPSTSPPVATPPVATAPSAPSPTTPPSTPTNGGIITGCFDPPDFDGEHIQASDLKDIPVIGDIMNSGELKYGDDILPGGKEAIMALQTAMGCTMVDGIIGPETRGLIMENINNIATIGGGGLESLQNGDFSELLQSATASATGMQEQANDVVEDLKGGLNTVGLGALAQETLGVVVDNVNDMTGLNLSAPQLS